MVNKKGHGHTAPMTGMASTGVFILYTKNDEAMKAIEAVDGTICDGRPLR
jgi:hypothetical protein